MDFVPIFDCDRLATMDTVTLLLHADINRHKWPYLDSFSWPRMELMRFAFSIKTQEYYHLHPWASAPPTNAMIPNSAFFKNAAQ